MFRCSLATYGSYLLNQRLIADWWQAGQREEVHQAAKARLSAALEEVEKRSSSAPKSSAARVDEDGGPSFSSLGSRQRVDAPPHSPPLSLYEANGLVSTFVSSHNTQDLSATLQYIREQLREDLTPYHFHSLLRTFNYHHDVANALQVLEVMMHSGTTTLETYARMVDCVHCLSPPDVEARLLQLVALAQEAFGTHVMEDDAGSEAGTVAAYSFSGEGRQARETAADVTGVDSSYPSSDAATSKPAQLPRSAPVLSSLLYHCSTTSHRSTVASCVVVAIWIRAFGVELTDWDVLSVLSSVLTHTDEFPQFCAMFSSFDAHERGTVSVQAVVERLVLLGEVVWSGSSTTNEFMDEHVESSERGSFSDDKGKARAKPSATSTLTSLVEAMQASLRAAGVDPASAVVSLPFVNAQTNSMEQLVAATLLPLIQTGVGPHYYNAGHLFHALSLVQSSMGDDTGAIQLLQRAACEQQRCTLAQEALGMTANSRVSTGESSGRLTSFAEPSSSLGVTHASAPATREPYSVSIHHLLDMGTLLSRVSATTLRDVQRPFHGALRHMMAGLSGRPTEKPSDFSASPSSSWPSVVASCTPPVPCARDLVTVSSRETQFICTVSEARTVLRCAIDAGKAIGSHGRLPHSTQFMLMQLAELCCRHPPRNPKLTPAGLEERTKWGRYLDARDTSLALFGSAQHSRDSMKHLFYNDNQLPELRSEVVIAKDFADVHELFFGSASPSSLSQAELQASLRRTRTTLPHTGSSAAIVPRYLWDPAVYNPYPAAQLAINTCEFSMGSSEKGTQSPFTLAEIHQTDAILGDDAEGDFDGSEFFVELWQTLLDKTTSVGSNEVWYLQNTDMFLLLLRCLLHRLDWETAAHLTRKMTQHANYTYLMDHELTTIFREIGDPAGCLAFKVATKLFDGRITKDGQTKRERFHQEQFR
ncbi:conserved hypothetical protein [Leishmania braziliensis MHOM/BR/75/M2904]|uniref:Uncharacterized protein n=2 Tax=Leishmania braziliensis TaxID=5660 RepID=A4HI47_LEIBR|nr:conserved hypothetical protein [Leishmania braziliensis MHOM/BR/75/M2904]CAJ2477065.1 unnamed protein product [Leishmania braziliensis]CAM40253.1 conserved hypothetical protein [Leishmania braziliensis MHOM/BR/75/M2904]SYZ67913.1 hypothetical_protein [Leishmania braziliensis MHOM/BR/75/M2904]